MGGALQERLGAREFPRRALQCLVREVDPTVQQRADLGLSDLPEVVGDMAVYKSGDTYYGARSNEFGYANYELLLKGPANLVEIGNGEYREKDQSTYLRVTE